jgi:hypothetical protein
MLCSWKYVCAAALFLAAPAMAQEVLPAPAAPARCSAGKLETDMTAFIGPEDADAASPRMAASATDEPGAIVGSLPERIEKPPRRLHPMAE